MNQKIELKTSEDQKELIIREGKALELKEPLVMNITGDIDTVKNFVKKRYATGPTSIVIDGENPTVIPLSTTNSLQAIDKDLAVVTFDKKNLSISLDVNPQDFYGPKVTGKMEISDELKLFSINDASGIFSRDQLVKLLRYNKRFFTDAIVHDKVLKAFQNLSLTGNTQLNAGSDNRGNKNAEFKKTIDSQNIPTTFYLTLPIFKGQPAVKFLVEICLDSSESSVIFWFESVELAELQAAKVDEVFEAQKLLFSDFVIVNK